jgi:hypothetical protein
MIRLRDEQWERIRDHFPEENIADGRPGRKPIPTRCVLEAVLYWPAPGSEDTELGVLMELEVRHGETEVHAGIQA